MELWKMNKKDLNKKLMFLGVASTIVLTNQKDFKIKANEESNILTVPEVIFTKGIECEPVMTSYNKFQEDMAEIKRLKKLEEERLESLKTYIYVDSNDLRVHSDITVEQLTKLLQGTQLENLAQDFINAQNIYGINAIFLTSLAANESGWGTSWLANNKNNLTGYQAYPGREKDARYFETKADSIMRTAQLISEDYLNPNGKYHNGFSIESVNMKYCLYGDGSVNYNWTNTIKEIMYDLTTRLVSVSEELKEDPDASTLVFFNSQL